MRSWILRPCQPKLCRRSLRPLARGAFPLRGPLKAAGSGSYRPSSGLHRLQASITADRSLVALPDSPVSTLPLQPTPPVPQPHQNKKEPAAWIELLEPFLPSHLSVRTISIFESDPIGSRTVSKIVEQAKEQSQLDLISILSVERGRWDAATWLACAVIDNCKTPNRPWNIPDVFSSVQWPQNRSLQQLSSVRRGKEDIEVTSLDHLKWDSSRTSKTSKRAIAFRLRPFVGQRREDSVWKSHAILGQLWLSLGKMVLSAAEKNLKDSSEILSRSAFILSRFHQRGFLPDAVHQKPYNTDITALQQSPLVAELSAKFLLTTNLYSDTIGLISDHVTDKLKSKIEGHAPDQWLEYILWCCVHGGWFAEGTAIVDEMRKSSGRSRWSLMYWRHMQSASGTTMTLPANYETVSRAADLSSSGSAVKKTISTEVILALADGLAATIQGDRRSGGQNLATAVAHIHVLRKVLDRDNMSLGTSTWDAFIVRLINSPGLQEIDTSPRLFEQILDLWKAYGTEPNARNAPGQQDEAASSVFPSYVFESSAAVIGLFHRLLLANTRSRDVSGALKAFAALQRLTDTNKEIALKEFFAELKSTDVESQAAASGDEDVQVNNDSFPGVQFTGFFPSLPPSVVAELLDLLNDCESFDVGRWMISSSDIDGPLIPESEYGNQTISPALVRFAAGTLDTELLRKITRAQTSSVSGRTLVALCESRIRQGDFDGAVDVFGLVRQYALHEWSVSDCCLILRALLLQMYRSDATQTSEHAYRLCQRLLRGDMGQVWGPSLQQIDTIVEVLASFDKKLAEMCSNLIPRSQLFTANLPTIDFNYLLDAAVKVWGSEKGRQTWEAWCMPDSEYRVALKRVSETVSPGKSQAPTIAEQFSMAPSHQSTSAEPMTQKPALAGSIRPTLSTIRIIVHQALKEKRCNLTENMSYLEGPDSDDTVDRTGAKHDILDWAAVVLRQFGLSNGDVDYELEGYLSAQQPGQVMTESYSEETTRIWRAFTGVRRRWAQSIEEALRNFASINSGQQLVYDDQGPAERYLLLSLSNDLGLAGSSSGEGSQRSVIIRRNGRTHVPAQKVDEVLEEKP